MGYDFTNLSPADFEDLIRDLIGQELSIRFESFGAGPDGGIDGRHAVGRHSTILQAKHYVRSTFATLKAVMKKERLSVDKIRPKPKRYILATSRRLTIANKKTLARLMGPVLRSEGDIFCAADLNGLLRKFPEVERANIKLWLSGAAVLERVIRSAAYELTAMSRADIEAKVSVYAQNPSFKEARDKLERNHVVIISGPPGVGKTTLAEMLSYAYIGEEWEFVAIRSLDDGLAAIKDTKKQIFFFDDFLGQIALDARALASKDSDLARFIRRVQNSSNARFILTTRAPIFEEARRVSEHLGNPSLDIVKYLLDVGIYTRRIRARILYNHLFVRGTPKEHIKALWSSGTIRKIVDHKNYNPRIIEGMTDGLRTREISAEAYPKAFLDALDNPHQLWDTAFRTHIPTKCQHLLYGLFFSSEYGAVLDDLKVAYNAVHALLCDTYNIARDPKDFEESLRILEGGFIAINGTTVSFINPSVRDYLSDYLDDVTLLAACANAAQKADWAQSLWHHVRVTKLLAPPAQATIANAFGKVAQAFPNLPVMKPDPTEPNVWRFHDLGLAERISLLLEWNAATGAGDFIDIAMGIAAKPRGGFSAWNDGVRLVRLLHDLRSGDFADLHRADELAAGIEDALIDIFAGHVWADDLDSIYEEMERQPELISVMVFDAARRAIEQRIESAMTDAAGIESESTLEDHIKAFERLAPLASIPPERVQLAISEIQSRIAEIKERTEKATSPEFSGQTLREKDKFDDLALRNLFEPLVSA